MINGKFSTSLIQLILILLCFQAEAQVQSISAIKKTAKSFLEQQFSADKNNVTIRIGQMDPRLRLTPCTEPLTAFVPRGTNLKGNAIIGVRCVGQKSWHIYVPVYLEIRQKVLKYSRSLPKGHQIGPEDLAVTEIDISHLRGAPVADPDKVIGSVLKRRVRADSVVQPDYLCMVCKGDDLTIISGNDRFYVSMEGEALEDGHFGERVKIQNIKSDRIITGTVIAKQKVKVGI